MSEDLGTPLPPMEEPLTPMLEPKKKSNTTLIIVIVVLVLLCCCCGFILLFYYKLGDPLLEWLRQQGIISLHLLLAA